MSTIGLQEKYNISALAEKSFIERYTLAKSDTITIDDTYKMYLQSKPKPFVKWVGGKRQLLKQFKKLKFFRLPPNGFNLKKSTYYEPFVGGGAVFFDFLPRNALLSDMNAELVTTYNVIKNDVHALIRSLKYHKNDKEYFLKMRAKDLTKMTDVQIASRFIYLNRTAFNGMYRVNQSGGFNVPFGKYDNPKICDADNLLHVHNYLQGIDIKHQDYTKVLEVAKKGDFIYFDPPYAPLSPTSSFTAYTKDGFGAQQQIELRDAFFELHKRGCYVMLSNSNSDFINEIYGELVKKDKSITLHKVQANRMINADASKRGKIKEVLVVNY